MQLTDDEIREVLIRRKRAAKKRKKFYRRIRLVIISILILIVGVGIYVNRGAVAQPRGIIFVDAGHGGVDGGSKVGERLEKNDTLRLSLEIKKSLEKMGFRVYMSRTADRDVDRTERGKMANRKKAQLFISIHRNQANEGSGVEVYIPSNGNQASELLGNNIFKALVAQGFVERSVRKGTLVTPDDDYYENSVPTMPSCLVETGFLSSSEDNRIFDEKLEEIGQAIAMAVESTFVSLHEPSEEDKV